MNDVELEGSGVCGLCPLQAWGTYCSWLALIVLSLGLACCLKSFLFPSSPFHVVPSPSPRSVYSSAPKLSEMEFVTESTCLVNIYHVMKSTQLSVYDWFQ